MENYIKKQVAKLILFHKTKDIYFLCHCYNINILYGNFKKNGALYIDKNGKSFIFLKKFLSQQTEINVLIHEFAHYILHKKYLINHSAD